MERVIRMNNGMQSTRYDYNKLLSSSAYNHPDVVRKLKPEDFTIDYYHATGLSEPLLFECAPDLLGMNMVDSNFTVDDAQRIIGGNKTVTVADVTTQKAVRMPLSKFVRCFSAPAVKEREKKIYNLIALDFTNSLLAEFVSSPSLLHSIDWTRSWPDELKRRSVGFNKSGEYEEYMQFPATNSISLISPAGAFTDVHLDFGGTSFWFHVAWGLKVFFLIPPSEKIFEAYETYMRSSPTGIFFGEMVDRCVRVEVQAGSTLIVPSGWIHAVITPKDTLAFSGNFLHTRAVSMQLRIQRGEGTLRLNSLFRYPLLDELMLFHLAALVEKITQRKYIRPSSRNEGADSMEYVGERFVEEEGRKRIPSKQDYNNKGGLKAPRIWEETDAYTTSLDKLRKWNVKEGREGEMEKENLSKGGVSDGKEQEEMEGDSRLSTQNDDFYGDHLTFYTSKSGKYKSGPSSLDKFPICDEPLTIVDLDELRESIHIHEIVELEALLLHLIHKPKLSLPEGLTRPNSLLAAFGRLLRTRREQTEKEGIVLPPTELPEEKEKRGRKRAERKGGDEEDSDWTSTKEKRSRKVEDAKEEERGMVTRRGEE